MNSLLNKAKEIKTNERDLLGPTKEQVELALAWAHNEVRLIQVMKVLGVTQTTAYLRLARSLRKYIQDNNL